VGWQLLLDLGPGVISLAVLHGTQDDPARDADCGHAIAIDSAGHDGGHVEAVLGVIAVDKYQGLADEPVGDVLACEGASVRTNTEVVDVCAPAAEVGATNGGVYGWLGFERDWGRCRGHVGGLERV
jgi:hypothetical protein